MIEPRPREVRPPEGGEPRLRVGVVLAGDRRRSVAVTVPGDGWTVGGVPLPAGRTVTLAVDEGRVVAVDGDRTLFSSREPVLVTPPGAEPLRPGGGVAVAGVTVGRGFHWQHQLDETLPGSLEAHAAGEALVLVNVVGFEEYLACVISSEMSADCPADFCKAQAVAARSWALVFLGHKHVGQPYTICNDDDCQRYQGTTHLKPSSLAAARGCRGEVLLTGRGFVCPAYYAKSCGGHGEAAEHAFGFPVEGLGPTFDAPLPESCEFDLTREADFGRWLSESALAGAGVFCSPEAVRPEDLERYLGAVDVTGTYFRWEHVLPAELLLENLRTKFSVEAQSVLDLVPGPRGVSGRLGSMAVAYRDRLGKRRELRLPDQYEVRRALHQSFLYSSAFMFDVARADDRSVVEVRLRGAGWGHGVGLCQIGALGFALSGGSYRSILEHYYPECRVAKAYD